MEKTIDIAKRATDARERYDALMLYAVTPSAREDVNRYLTYPLSQYFRAGGKRLRPLFCEVGCALVGGDVHRVESVARAIECFHTAALIHDDIEDGALTRRGMPAFHVSEGTPVALNAGDYGLTLVFRQVLRDGGLTGPEKVRVLDELTEMTATTIEGQAMDLGWARDGRTDASPEDVLYMYEAKTAVYSCAVPLALGAYLGGGSAAQVEALRNIGVDVGVAYQITDDLLNLEGNETALGKECLTDLREGKYTVIVAYALAHAEDPAHLRGLLEAAHHAADAAYAARDALRKTGAFTYAHDLIEAYRARAQARLEAEFAPSDARALLSALIDRMVNRSC